MAKVVYGVSVPDNWSELQCELFLFYFGNGLAKDPYWRPPKESLPGSAGRSEMAYTGDGRFTHFQRMCQMFFPKMVEWNEWAEKLGRAFCENKHNAICGCAGSGKSTIAGLYAFFFLLAAPNDTAVLIASTTIDAAKKRIWKEIRKFFTEAIRLTGGKLGDLTLIGNPKPCIRSSKTDTAHGIYVVAVAKGEVEKGVEALKGFHPKRLLMIGDETDSINQAVVDVGANQEVGTLEYQTIWLGNDPSMFNPLGRMMEPEKGKPVSLGHTDWISTTGIHCLRLDAYDSPNLRDGDKWKGIIRKVDIEAIVNRFGENAPQVWIMLRGIHPPEGADSTVVSEALLNRYNCSIGVTWQRGCTLSATLDPAFGGDKCVYRVFGRGKDTTGKMRFLLMEKIVIQVVATDTTTPAEYQIANKVMEFNKARGIQPEEFSLDMTGIGRGVMAVLRVQWSPAINECNFGGSPSDMPVSEEDNRPAKEAYDRKVTELWFSFREFVMADMIRGLDSDTAVEFCQRRFEIRSKKTCLEKKEDMKLRGLESPDFADAVVVYIHMVREKGFHASVVTDVKTGYVDDFEKKLRDGDIDGWTDTYSSAVDEMKEGSYIDIF